MEKRLALLYGFEEDLQAVCSALEDMDIVPIPVSPEQGGEQIGFLCGMTGYRALKNAEMPEKPERPMMVFGGLDLPQGELTKALQVLKNAGIAVDALKGVITETNARWTMDAISREYLQEQQIMGALRRLETLRRSIPMPDPSNVPLMMALVQAGALLSGTREVTVEEVEKAYLQLQNAMK